MQQFGWDSIHRGFLVAQTVGSLSALWETQVRSLGWEDPMEKKMATHANILAQEITWTEEPGGQQSMEFQRAGHNLATKPKYWACNVFI